MRPIASEQDPLRTPLNELFGTKAHVRLLRVMAVEAEGPLTASEAAKRAGLTVPGAQKALANLFRFGFLNRVGGGRSRQYEIRSSDRLMQAALALFKVEKERYDQMLLSIKHGAEKLSPPPHALWIQQGPRKPGESLTIGLLQDSLHLTDSLRQLRSWLDGIEDEFNLIIELEGYTKADMLDLRFEDVTVLYGVVPHEDRSSTPASVGPLTHPEKERQLDSFSRKLAKILEQDPSLLRRAKDHIDHLLKENQGTATRDLVEWRGILERYPMGRLLTFLTSSSERARRLRQSNPFFAVLGPDHKAELLRSSEVEHDTGSA